MQYLMVVGLLTRTDAHGTPLERHRAFVLGGSGGIGRAVTYALAAAGADVICHGGHDEERLARVVDYVRSSGGRAQPLFVPIRRATDIVPVLADLGRVDILVVGFGPMDSIPLADLRVDDWIGAVDLNLVLPGLLVTHLLPGMVERGWGRIVLFTGPHAGRQRGLREAPAYQAAKEGVVSLVRSAALVTNGRNVSVNAISPGYVETEYHDAATRRRMAQRSPRGAAIQPERIARVVRDLVAASEPDINGSIIAVDQGLA